MFFLFFSICCTGCSVYAIEEEKALGNFLSPVAVQEVLTGKRKTANAAWWGFNGEVRWDPSQPDGQPRQCIDTSRAKSEFGFEAKTIFDEGLEETVGWYRKHKAK